MMWFLLMVLNMKGLFGDFYLTNSGAGKSAGAGLFIALGGHYGRYWHPYAYGKQSCGIGDLLYGVNLTPVRFLEMGVSGGYFFEGAYADSPDVKGRNIGSYGLSDISLNTKFMISELIRMLYPEYPEYLMTMDFGLGLSLILPTGEERGDLKQPGSDTLLGWVFRGVEGGYFRFYTSGGIGVGFTGLYTYRIPARFPVFINLNLGGIWYQKSVSRYIMGISVMPRFTSVYPYLSLLIDGRLNSQLNDGGGKLSLGLHYEPVSNTFFYLNFDLRLWGPPEWDVVDRALHIQRSWANNPSWKVYVGFAQEFVFKKPKYKGILSGTLEDRETGLAIMGVIRIEELDTAIATKQVETALGGVASVFEIRLPAPQKYTLRAEREGYIPKDTVVLVMPGKRTDVRITLKKKKIKAGLIVGRVIDKETGTPLTAVIKFVGKDIPPVKSDARKGGQFKIRLPYGVYAIRVEKTGYVPYTEVVNLREKAYTLNVELVKKERGIVLRGTVLDEKTGEPVEAKVEIVGVEVAPVTAYNGKYEIVLPKKGSYIIRAEHKDYLPFSGLVACFSPVTEYQIKLVPKPKEAILMGCVRDRETGEPISGAKIKLAETGIIIGETDSLGVYKVKLLPERYILRVEKEGYIPAIKPVVIPGREGAVCDIELYPAKVEKSSIEGMVIDYFDKTPVKAKITFPSTRGKPSISCDADGKFKIILPVGEHIAKITAYGYVTQLSKVTCEAGVTKKYKFKLIREGKPLKFGKIKFKADGTFVIPPSTSREIIKLLKLHMRSKVIAKMKIYLPGISDLKRGEKISDAFKDYFVKKGIPEDFIVVEPILNASVSKVELVFIRR